MRDAQKGGAFLSLGVGLASLATVDFFLLPQHLESIARSEARESVPADQIVADPSEAPRSASPVERTEAEAPAKRPVEPVAAEGQVADKVAPASTATPLARVEAAPAQPEVRSWRVRFRFGKADVGRRGRRTLDAVAEHQRKLPGRIEIVGRATPAGTRAYNLALSRDRARAAARGLRARGVDASALRVRGVGERAPPGERRQPEALRRRVDILWRRP